MMNALDSTEEENVFRLENSEHEDADRDDLPLSFLLNLSSFDIEKFKSSSNVNNLNNVQDTCRISTESSKETIPKNSPRTVEPVCSTSPCALGSPFTNEGTQYDVPKNSITQSKEITYPSSESKLVSQRTQYDKADCQITQSVQSIQTSQLLHISEGIQCDLDDGISNNVVSSSYPQSDFESFCVSRCMCCKRDLEACKFLDTVNSSSDRMAENYVNEKEADLEQRLDSPKGNEHLCGGGEIINAYQNPIISSKKLSSPVPSTTNSYRDGVKTNEDTQPLTYAEQTEAVSSSQNHKDVSITFSNNDEDSSDTCVENDTEKARNQQLPNDITRNEDSSAFEAIEKADYVALWINKLVPESTSSPHNLAEETEDVLEPNEKVSNTALQQCSKHPVISIKKRVNSTNKCGSDTNNEMSLISSTSESSPETLRTKNKSRNKILATRNRRNMIMDRSCRRFSKREKNPASLQCDVEDRNGISSAIPAERADFVLSWINNLVPENASLSPSSVEETEDVRSNQEISNAGTQLHSNSECLGWVKEKRMKSMMNCDRDTSNDSSGLSLSSSSLSSPEMLRTENSQCSRTVFQQHNSALSSVTKRSNIELIRKLESEDLECAKAFEEFLASSYYKEMKEYERSERKKLLCSKTKLNEESTMRQLKHHDQPVRNRNPRRQIQQKFVVQESQSDDSSIDVRLPNKRKYICLSGVEPDDNQNVSKRKLRQPYTMWERKKIINYIIEKNKFSSVKGEVLWKEMERAKVCDRTWQSMKEHFRKQILPRIEYYQLEPGIVQKFLSLQK